VALQLVLQIDQMVKPVVLGILVMLLFVDLVVDQKIQIYDVDLLIILNVAQILLPLILLVIEPSIVQKPLLMQ
jgi:hypothetical protein